MLHLGGYVFLKYVEYGLMDRPVACDQFLLVNRVQSAVEVRYLAAGFSEDDDSRRHIPRV